MARAEATFVREHARMAEDRRLVSVLFADVSGSSSLAETEDPEDLRALLGRYYAIAKRVVGIHGGTLEKFIGDAVMAVFGMPIAHEDDAVRAIGSALELRDLVRADAVLGDRLPIRLGVSTGEVVASTDPGRGDFLVTGEAVNAAARLQQSADPWEILVTDRAVRAARGRFVFGEPRPIDLRGRRSPVAVRSVIGPAPWEAPRRTRFVGRETDLAELELAARRAFAGRRPYLVTVIAPAGAGKSRLVEEFLAHRLPPAANAKLVTVRCTPYGERLTYEPLGGLLPALAGLDERTDAQLLRTGARDWLISCGDESAARHAELLALTIGAGAGEVADRAALFGAWRTAIELAARQRPLVLVLEDLHWASDSLLDLLEFVLDPSASAALLVLVLARPELLGRRPTWAGGRPNALTIGLEPLATDEMRRLVGSLVRGRARPMIGSIVERAEGNPFYAEELVQAAIEGDGETADLPDSVQGTILARLDQLDPGARRLLQVGSIFGRQFTLDGAATIDPETAPDVDASASSLARRDLVVREVDGSLAIRHVLIQEVAYQTLPRSERARLHEGAGRWLEGEAAGREDQAAARIALHLSEAVRLERSAGHEPDADNRRRAISWSRRAAEVAYRAGASVEAAEHVRAALAIAREDATPDLHELLGDVLLAGDAAIEAYAAGLTLADRCGWGANDRLRLLGKQLTAHARWQGSVARRLSDPAMATLLREAEGLLAGASDDRAIAVYLIGRGFLPFWYAAGGQRVPVDPSAAEGVRRGLDIAAALGDPLLQSAALDALSGIAQSQGQHEEARDHARRRIDFEDRLDLNERLDAYAFFAWESCLLGDFRGAERMTRRAVELIEPERAPTAALHAVAWRGFAQAMLGDWDGTLATIAMADALWSGAGGPPAGYAAHGFLAAAEICRARHDEAAFEHWRSVIDTMCDPFPAGSFARTPLAIVQADAAAVRAAIERPVAVVERPHLIDRALFLAADAGWELPSAALDRLGREADAQGLRPLAAAVRRARGLLRHDASDLRTALATATELEERPLVARLQVELGTLEGAPDLVEHGRTALDALGDRTPLAGAAQPV